MDEPLIPELDVPVLFRSRPLAIPGDLRPVWRIGVLTMLLKNCCRGGRSSLRRLHVLSWCVQAKDAGQALEESLDGRISPDTVLIRIEPAVNRAIDLAIGERLIRRGGKDRVELTEGGKEFARIILEDENVFVREKAFASRIGYRLSEAIVRDIFHRGDS